MIPPKVLVELEMVERMLRSRGVAIDQLQELVDGRVPREALPVLIMALPEVDTPEVRRTIIRALTDRAARGIAARPLIRELARAKAEGDELTAWVVGNALCQVGDDSVSEDLVAAVRDPSFGRARETLAEALGRVEPRPQVVAALTDLLSEGAITGHAIGALGKLGAWEARAAVEPFLTHPMPWVRKEATKALERMEKAQARPEQNKARASLPRTRSSRG